jgi:hypothetical protein
MFFEEVKQSFIAQGHAIAAKLNQDAVERFLGACRNWAANGGRDGEPKPDLAMEAEFSFEGNWTMRIVATDRFVSTIDPKSFLQTFGTDRDAIGGPVGGPIPNQPGRYYAASDATPYLGQVHRNKDKTYVFTAITPFNRAWEEI